MSTLTLFGEVAEKAVTRSELRELNGTRTPDGKVPILVQCTCSEKSYPHPAHGVRELRDIDPVLDGWLGRR